MVMPEEERRNTAFHESGHAVVAYTLPKADPVHKVTIIPRGRALGITWMLPEHDRYGKDRERLLQDIAVSLGGRHAGQRRDVRRRRLAKVVDASDAAHGPLPRSVYEERR